MGAAHRKTRSHRQRRPQVPTRPAELTTCLRTAARHSARGTQRRSAPPISLGFDFQLRSDSPDNEWYKLCQLCVCDFPIPLLAPMCESLHQLDFVLMAVELKIGPGCLQLLNKSWLLKRRAAAPLDRKPDRPKRVQRIEPVHKTFCGNILSAIQVSSHKPSHCDNEG
jgi:hypothetical protein